MADLFGELKAKGEGGVTASLRKVTDDMKAKNQAERSSKVITRQGSGAYSSDPPPPKGQPSIECSKDTWTVSSFVGVKGAPPTKLPSDDALAGLKPDDLRKQTVSIMDCQNISFVLQPDKMNTVMLHKCFRVNVIINSLISGVEMCDCSKVKIQVLGVAPSIAIDKSTGVDIYLSKESKMITEFTTSKSGEMNLNFPGPQTTPGEEPEWVETAIPEQFVSSLGANHILKTEVSHLYSS
eukprot:GHVQ01037513.1.p1 GENE.GHVQ01037513.1~~GHVQ01037513.1.p1  ORF type:complete len:238 (+),score=38.08 GHVQ01037513.1:277-990(+)